MTRSINLPAKGAAIIVANGQGSATILSPLHPVPTCAAKRKAKKPWPASVPRKNTRTSRQTTKKSVSSTNRQATGDIPATTGGARKSNQPTEPPQSRE